ncbi:MAG: hypothetical protein H0W63_01415 [Gemmatimonadaceae bacterium]|nr:hypothetical protein [Gemmatimonadaceae bacterium]
MFIELVELLRCIRAHDESWLVASIDELHERSIRRGTLGCPVCQAEYRIIDGTADFSGATASAVPAAETLNSYEVALRAGAFLGLADSAGTVILGGSWAAGASTLAESTGARAFTANAMTDAEQPGVGRILVQNIFPFAIASCAGIALDATFDDRAVEGALRVIRPGGRIVGPAAIARPDGVALLAEDAEWWVGEKPPEVTTLRRGSR